MIRAITSVLSDPGSQYEPEGRNVGSLIHYAFGERPDHAGPAAWVFAEASPRCLCPTPVQEWVGFAAMEAWGALGAGRAEGAGFQPSEHRGIRAYAPEAVRAALEGRLQTVTRTGPVDHESLAGFVGLALRLSTQREEGRAVAGDLAYVDSLAIDEGQLNLCARLAGNQLPTIERTKHIGKLLTASGRSSPLVIRGRNAVGFGSDALRTVPGVVWVEFSGRYGLIRVGEQPIALVRDGSLLGCGHEVPFLRPLIEQHLPRRSTPGHAGQIADLVGHVAAHGHGATVLIDVSGAGKALAGHTLEAALRLEEHLPLVARLAGIDGAIVVSPGGKVNKFAGLLDGATLGAEDLARGARYNTAWRYSAAHPRDLLLVLSADGPVTVFAGGRVVYPVEPPNSPVPEQLPPDPPLEEWIEANGTPTDRRGWRRGRRLAALGRHSFARVMHEERAEERRAARARARGVRASAVARQGRRSPT